MAERVLGPTGSRRRRRLLFVPLLLGMCAAAFYIAGAGAVAAGTSPQDNGLFQLDGNTLPTDCASPFPGLNAGDGDDWAALFTHQPTPPAVTPPCGSDGFSFVGDGVGNADHTYWSQGGSKDSNDPALGPWLWKPNDVSPDKNDLVNAFAAIYTGANDARFLYFGSDRFDTSGDAQQGFQFLQAATCLAGTIGGANAGGTAACGSDTPSNPTGCTPAFSGSNSGYFVDPATGCPVHHTNGDLLILVNFNKGGTLGLAGVYEWFGANGAGAGCYGTPPAGPLAGQCDQPVLNGSGANCGTITPPDDFCSIANTAAIATEPIWPYSAKGGGTTYKPSAFIEGGVNLARIAGAGSCFPSFVAETRSSAGPSSGLGLSAQLKDLAFGRFELCAPSTSLAKTASPTTIRSGDTVTYTYRETNDGRDPLTQVSVTDDSCSPLVRGTDDPGNNDNTLSPGETWVFTCAKVITTSNSSVINTATATGFDTGLNKTVTFCAGGVSTSTCFHDPDERATATVTIIHPATSLTQNASIAVVFTYVEDNTGDDTLSSPTVTDTNCSPVTYSSGDTNNDGKLQPDETWTFTCTKAATTSGTNVNYTAAATGSGTDSLGGSVGGASDAKENESVDVAVTHHHHS